MSKFENPIRLMELLPKETLIDIGLKKGDLFCDIGAGTGVFTIEAAIITGVDTYAIDISEEMLSVIEAKANALDIENIQLIKASGFDYPIEEGVCDFAFMCSTLHEIYEKPQLLKEIHRILKRDGKLAVIEFHKSRTPLGPPEQNRISMEETKEIVEEHGFAELSKRNLGENYYLCTFKKN